MSDTQNQWIPVSERLPENSATKLVMQGAERGIRLAAYWPNDGKWILAYGTIRLSDVTHWMDLPEPPHPPKPADPFEAWADENARSFPYFNTESCHAAWDAAKEHYAKPLPDFETWWDKLEPYSCKARRFNDVLLRKDFAQAIWNAAQGKPVA